MNIFYFDVLNITFPECSLMNCCDLLTTACGKLAKNLEVLIEKTQMWSNGDNGTPLLVSPSVAQVPAEVDVVIPDMRAAPAVVNGHWINQGPGTQKPSETIPNPHKDGLFTEVN